MDRREFMDRQSQLALIDNVTQLTRTSLNSTLNGNKDINFSCGYPNFISTQNYDELYTREGVAKKVVTFEPSESWRVDPSVVEDDKPEDTVFEKDWKALEKQFKIYQYLHRVDRLSRIGKFGVLLIGIGDSLDLALPSTNINEDTGKVKDSPTKHDLLFLRPFREKFVDIKTTEHDHTSPRFGLPKMYSLRFEQTSQSGSTMSATKNVHWTRIVHIADNRDESEVFGVPAMQDVFNRLVDIRKVLSGSGEMFWKGAFPGYSFEINKDVKNATMDTASIREEFDKYSNGLQRYLALEGVTAKSLEVQSSSPKEHMLAQYQYVALAIGVPLRIFLGSEQAKLASTEDKKTWNDKVARRQNQYVSPMVLEPTIDRLIALGIIKGPASKQYETVWPDLNTPSDKDIAEVGNIKAKALAAYISGDVASVIAPADFMVHILKMDQTLVKGLIERSKGFVDDGEPEGDDD